MPPILLLHLSDLHFGPHSRFQGEKPERLGKSFHRALAAAQKQLGIERKVDLVCVTGDIAEAGQEEEFETGRSFLSALAGEIGLPPQKFVFVPGNHDINWDSCQEAFFKAKKEKRTSEPEIRSALDGAKFEFYDAFVQRFYGKEDPRELLAKGAFLYRYEDLSLVVAALNSTEKESHRSGDHVGFVSREQAEAAMGALRRADLASWLKVVAIHHNPDRATRNNIDDWQKFLLKKGKLDEALLARYESDALGLEGRDQLVAVAADAKAQLLLHGHQHASDKLTWDWREGKGHTHVFSAGSLSLNPDKLPHDEPASVRLIVLDPEQKEIRADRLAYLAWHRVEGEVEWGSFAPDSNGTIVVDLDLPEGFTKKPATPSLSSKTPVDAEFLRAFRQRFAEQYAPWDLGSLGAVRLGGIHEVKEARLDEMYLELRFDLDLDLDRVDAGEPLRVEDLLNRDIPLSLTGVAGAGKTTWARYTFRQLVKDDRALPLMLVLRDVARSWEKSGSKGEDLSIDAALDNWVGAQMGGGWKRRLSKILKANTGPRPILLVDGWDELGPHGEKFRDKLMGFLRANPRVLAVVTSRPYGEQRPSHADGFEKLEVQPLSNVDIKVLTRKFFAQYSANEASGKKEDLFLSALASAPEARALAQTPLLLTMMLLVGYSQPLPDKRHLLYAKCIDALLHDRPKQKEDEGAIAGRNTWCPPGLDQRRRWVATLAYHAQTEAYRQIKRKTLFQRGSIVRTWKELASFVPAECPAERRDGFLAWLVEVAGLLVERTDGGLSFTHLSFQEYLTALHIATTTADHDQRCAAFRDRIIEVHWWETLRLLAAQVDSSNPEFLDIALHSLFAEPNISDETLSFLGTVLADGLGSEHRFRDWSRFYLPLLALKWPEGAELCSRVWLGTRQETRKGTLARDLESLSVNLDWIGRQRVEMFGEGWAPITAIPRRATTRGIATSLQSPNDLSREAIAAGRIIVGGFPAWPDEHGVGALNLWPGRRRLAGLRFQLAAAAGASRESLIALARRALIPPAENEQARDWARRLARYWAHDWARGQATDRVRHWAGDFARDLARNLASDLARDLIRDLDLNMDRYSVGYLGRYWDRNLNLARDWVHDLACELPRHWAHDWAHYWAQKLDLDPGSSWLENFGLSEMFSHGRALARGYFAHLERSSSPLHLLLSKACSESLSGWSRGQHVQALDEFEHLDPLWPALARHIARMSTSEDKALLDTLARGDGQCSEPLSWGLQFIVRGDVLLDDGSIVTLDELADEAGVPHLPYLEEIEPELEVDWEGREK